MRGGAGPLMKLIPPACVMALALLAARTSVAEVLFEPNFEEGKLPFGSGSNLDRWTVVKDPVREGRYAAKIELRPTDEGASGLIRSEAGYFPDASTFLDHEHYYAWSI